MKFFLRAPLALFLLTAVSCATPPAAYHKKHPGAAPRDEGKPPESVMYEEPKDRSRAYYHYMLGLIEERNGQYDKAIKSFKEAADSDDTLIQAFERASSLELRMGRVNNARDLAERGLNINPDYVPCLVILGAIHSSLNEYETAAMYFKRIVEAAPDRKDAWIYLAVAYLKSGLNKESLEVLEEYDRKYPNDVMGLYYKGRVFAHMKEWDKGKDAFKTIIRLYPDYSKGYEGLAWLYRAQKKFDKAVEVYKQYLEKAPQDEEMKAKLAETYLVMESFGDAVSQYEELVDKEPDDMNLHFRLGLSHMRQAAITGNQEEYEKALDQFQLVRTNDPGNAKVTYYIANIFERLNLIDEAIETWKLLLGDERSRRDVCLKISELYEKSGKPEMSLEYAKEACKADPAEPELYFFIGLLQNKLHRNEEARDSFLKAISLRPDDEKYHFYLGVVYEKMKLYDKCVEAMEKVIQINPKHANALNYVGYIYAEKSVNLEKAEEYLVKALELEPENGYFIDSLAWIYYKQGRHREALERMQTAVRHIPPDPTVLEHLGDVYMAVGDFASAEDAYERSLKAEPDDDRVVDRDSVKKKLSETRKKLKKGDGK